MTPPLRNAQLTFVAILPGMPAYPNHLFLEGANPRQSPKEGGRARERDVATRRAALAAGSR
eukprot:6629711-Pyramimonas_sp.AAC.1